MRQPGHTLCIVDTLDRETGEFLWATPTITQNVCARMRASTFEDEEASRLYAIAWRSQLAPGTDQVGAVHAISAETGATTWVYEQRAATMSLAATGGGLVFGGDVNGRFRAFDDRTGEVLREINLGSSVSGFPITYAVGGRQYVAVSTGTRARRLSWDSRQGGPRAANGRAARAQRCADSSAQPMMPRFCG